MKSDDKWNEWSEVGFIWEKILRENNNNNNGNSAYDGKAGELIEVIKNWCRRLKMWKMKEAGVVCFNFQELINNASAFIKRFEVTV
jgi:hypothetical protein